MSECKNTAVMTVVAVFGRRWYSPTRGIIVMLIAYRLKPSTFVRQRKPVPVRIWDGPVAWDIESWRISRPMGSPSFKVYRETATGPSFRIDDKLRGPTSREVEQARIMTADHEQSVRDYDGAIEQLRKERADFISEHFLEWPFVTPDDCYTVRPATNTKAQAQKKAREAKTPRFENIVSEKETVSRLNAAFSEAAG